MPKTIEEAQDEIVEEFELFGDDAEADATASLELSLELGLDAVAPAPVSLLVDVHRERDRLDEAEELLVRHGLAGPTDPMSAEAPVALVTGGARGLGEAIASRLHADGHHVVVADVNEEGAVESAARMAATGGTEAHGIAIDVRDDESVASAVADVERRFGRLDVLVNNAGVVSHSRSEDLDSEVWMREIDINLGGTMRCSRSALVAAMTRTSTCRGRTSPTGMISPCSRNRSSLGCTSIGRSPTSSRNSVPPVAVRTRPG